MTFLSVYTPTYKRPQALARCKASVAAQTRFCVRSNYDNWNYQ